MDSMSIQTDSFGYRLKQRRAETGVSQSDLADKADIGTAILSRYERGVASPKPITVHKLAEALSCSAEWLENGVITVDTEQFETISLPAPRDLLNRITEAAKKSGRDPVSEIIFRLEQSLDEATGKDYLERPMFSRRVAGITDQGIEDIEDEKVERLVQEKLDSALPGFLDKIARAIRKEGK